MESLEGMASMKGEPRPWSPTDKRRAEPSLVIKQAGQGTLEGWGGPHFGLHRVPTGEKGEAPGDPGSEGRAT